MATSLAALSRLPRTAVTFTRTVCPGRNGPSVASLSVGLYAMRDRWLSEADWETFKSDIAAIKAQGGQA